MNEQTIHEELAAVVAAQAPGLPAEKLDELAAAAAGLHISPETMQQILEAFDRVAEAVKDMEMCRGITLTGQSWRSR